MNTYTQEQEIQILLDAVTLISAIEVEKQQLDEESDSKFSEKRPVRMELKIPDAPEPPIVEKVPLPEKVKPNVPDKPEVTFTLADQRKKTKFVRIILWILLILSPGIGSALLARFILHDTGILFVPIPVIIPVVGLILLRKYNINMYASTVARMQHEIDNDPNYIRAVQDALDEAVRVDKENMIRWEVLQRKKIEEYQENKKQYWEVILPAYNEEADRIKSEYEISSIEYDKKIKDWKLRKQLWQYEHEEKIRILNENIQMNEEALSNLYDQTKLISPTYRELWILRWLYEDMKSTNHSLWEATELLDRDRERTAIREAGRHTKKSIDEMSKTVVSNLNKIYTDVDLAIDSLLYIRDASEKSASISEEVMYATEEMYDGFIAELKKTRRHVDIGNTIGIIQRYKASKK